MPRCTGHQSGLGWKCTVCGRTLSYKDAGRELLTLPEVEPEFPKVASLFVGVPAREAEGFSTVTLSAGDTESLSKGSFVATRTTGSGSWADFHSKYRDEVEGWFGAVGFSKAKYRLVVLDTTDPLSVLAVSALPRHGTIVFAVIADADSTPVQQNTSYVAMKAAVRAGLPVIACSKSFAHDAAYFAEGQGFQVGEGALGRVVDLVSSAVEDVAQFLADDVRLGVKLHCYSAVLSASDVVYKTLDDALSVQMSATSLEVYPDEVQTAFAAVFSGGASEQEAGKSFTRYRGKELKGVITAEHRVYPRPGDRRLYDLLCLFGIKEGEVFPLLETGYQKVAERAKELRLEALK